MKFSENWLREWVSPHIGSDKLLLQLTMAGLEVDSITAAAPELEKVVVGEIVKIDPHPNADKLQVTTVEIGVDTPLNIVCGAKNIYEGMKAPVAMVGAVLPGGFKIKPAKLRGVESYGMLCSENELGLTDEAQGIMDLPQDIEIGIELIKALELDDNCIEVDLTPNRGDCLSIRGIAREVGAINHLELHQPARKEISITSQNEIAVEILEPKACPIYLGRVIDDIDPTAQTPLWLQEKLRRSGVRSINPVVDVTNFVMLELGQPMHAFDLAQIDTKIMVRMAKESETLELLDGKELELNQNTLLIADKSKTLALAGVMGGVASGISDKTSSIFLECAWFNPLSISGIARRYGLHTDSSHRFERGVDPELQEHAINRATELLLDIIGGKVGKIISSKHVEHLIPIKSINLDSNNIKRILGIELHSDEIREIFTRLGLQVDDADDNRVITPPSWRPDLKLEADLIEEIARIYGYDRLPTSSIDLPLHLPQEQEEKLSCERLKQYFVNRGYFEVITYSFTDMNLLQQMGLEQGAIKISNPIANDLSVMRTSLLPSLIQTLRYNLNRQHKRVRLFETGLRFYQEDSVQQIDTLAGLVCGSALAEQWGESDRDVDFYDVKSDLENILGENIKFKADKHPSLHPGQTAVLYLKNDKVGYIGKIHPQIAKKLEVPENTYLFELDINPVLNTKLPKFVSLSKFPMLRRDLAIVLNDKIPAAEVIHQLKQNNFKFVREINIFDVYKGESLDSNKYSLALAFNIQHTERTLTDQDIENTMRKIVEFVKSEFAGELRE